MTRSLAYVSGYYPSGETAIAQLQNLRLLPCPVTPIVITPEVITMARSNRPTIKQATLRKIERLTGSNLANTTSRSREALGLHAVESLCDPEDGCDRTVESQGVIARRLEHCPERLRRELDL